MLSYLVIQIFNIICIILLISVLLSWIPRVNYYKQPFLFIKTFSEKFFEPFRNIIPPIGGALDISPIICFLVLQIIEQLLVYVLRIFGL